jgi:hypothetical protein
MNKIVAAKLETSNYEFTAYGERSSTAKLLLHQAFNDHIERTGGSLTWAEVEADVYFEEIITNTVVMR